MIGVGNRWRRDDAAGLAVAARLRQAAPAGVEVVEREGEPVALIDEMDGTEDLWLVDSASSGAAPGTLHRVDAATGELPAGLFGVSTHHVGLAEAVELARALGRLPQRTVVYGVEGARFDAGGGLSPEVEAAVGQAVEALLEELRAASSPRDPGRR